MTSTYDIKDKISVNVGLLGHIDSGKTAIAEVISEVISTAGIDAHPQSKKRGITIDMGFTSLILDKFLVTLVDVPGHADLIRTVVASIDIIDCAIIVIDAVHGPQIQTGEHLVILESFGIKNMIVALNKIDLISKVDLNKTITKIKKFFSTTSFSGDVPIYPVSARNKTGFDKLKEGILNLLNKVKIERNISGELIIPIDHHFPIKGIGTVITGTVLQGKVEINQNIDILPVNQFGRIKSIQTFKQDVNKAEAGDRVGIAIKGLDHKSIYRGCYAVTNKKIFVSCNIIEAEVQLNNYFKLNLNFGMQVHITMGMTTVPAYFFPYRLKEDKFIGFNPSDNDRLYLAIISTIEPILVKNLRSKNEKQRERFLISRLDLPVTTLRIAGIGKIIKIDKEPLLLYKYKIKTGVVKDPSHTQGIIVENLAESLIGAKKILGKKLEPPFDKIIDTFGTKGSVIVSLKKKGMEISKGEPVILKELRSFNVKRGKTHDL